MTYLEFLQTRSIDHTFNIFEAFKASDIDKVFKSIDALLLKKISNLIPLVGYAENTINDKTCISKQYIVMGDKPEDASMFQFNFIKDTKSLSCYSIDFCKDLSLLFSGNAKSDLSLYTLGGSLVKFLPIVCNIANNKKYNITDDEIKQLSQNEFKNIKESLFNIEHLQYNIFKNLSNRIIDETYNIVINRINEENKNIVEDELNNLSKLDNEDENKDINVAVKSKVNIISNEKNDVEDPEIVFQKMEEYIKMVLNGSVPSLIICGAPGMGKTYRVNKILEEAGYKKRKNMDVIKGTCTPIKLYVALYEYQDKNNILVIDDADRLVGPKAPEDSINILKAALDSTEDKYGREVSYNANISILDNDGDPVPKRFYYRGGCIVITNYSAGQLNTALRNRSFIQDINFTLEDTLKIIKDLMPKMSTDVLSMESKEKAYDYLVELSKNKNNPYQLSLRSFSICAKIFEAGKQNPSLTDSIIKSMIKEQMELQAKRGGKSY